MHVCQKCGKKFQHKESRDRHLKLCKDDGSVTIANLYACDTCGKVYNRRDNLKVHIAVKHTTNDKIFTCICGKVFRYKQGYNAHKKLLKH